MAAAVSALHLRRDISVHDAGFDVTGEPGLVLHDPLRHRFFRLPAEMGGLLEAAKTGDLKPDDAKELSGFLERNRLLEARPGSSQSLIQEWKLGQHSPFHTLLHSYISFRIPLFSPERFLDATLPWVMPLAAPLVLILLLLLVLVGGYFVMRQWDHFSAMFWSSFSIAGAFGFAATLFVLKIFHELGHAYVARYFGCRVPSIGVAFMVMTPMLYTDASDAWRLQSRWQRFLIGAAGVLVEMAIAAPALFFWAFLPDGPARAVCFFVAATAWVTSLTMNLSPFMRFDGYHMLVDALGMHSVGPRSFALATWRLRELLFATGDAPPEYFGRSLRRGLIAYAVGTWIYRLVVFGGIAWFLYVSLPKAAGLPLALVEVYFFILMPVIRELKVWKNMGLKHLFSSRRSFLSLGVFGLLLIAGLLPLDRHVQVPAVLLPVAEARLFPPEPAEVVAVRAVAGDRVQAGDILAELVVPEIGLLQRAARLKRDIADENLQRVAADRKDRQAALVQQREWQAAEASIQGLRQRGALLVIKAPVAGVVTGDAAALRPGQWVGRDTLLFQIVDDRSARIVGLMPERESGRMRAGAAVRFLAGDGVHARVDGVLTGLGLPGGEGQALPYLSSQFGGDVVTVNGREGPSASGYLTLHISTEAAGAGRAITGTAVVAAEPESVLGFLAKRVAMVFLRESGF